MPASDAVRAFIGLGSNLDDPRAQLRRACAALRDLPGCRDLQCSSFYLSVPLGPTDQPDFVNAVAALTTTLSPDDLLTALQAIEHAHRRDRSGPRWGPRTLDLDLLLYGDRVIDEAHLRVPHPGLAEREFVLHPLAEIAPGQAIPGYPCARELAAACPPRGMRRLAPEEVA